MGVVGKVRPLAAEQVMAIKRAKARSTRVRRVRPGECYARQTEAGRLAKCADVRRAVPGAVECLRCVEAGKVVGDNAKGEGR